MKLKCEWKSGMAFIASNGTHEAGMDSRAPAGADSQMNPKELVVAGLCGCTAMDVVGLMKKHKQELKSMTVFAEVETTHGVHPAVFTAIALTFNLCGTIEPAVLLEAVHLSQTKYCGVSAMLSKAAPISYEVILNGESIGKGIADFA